MKLKIKKKQFIQHRTILTFKFNIDYSDNN